MSVVRAAKDYGMSRLMRKQEKLYSQISSLFILGHSIQANKEESGLAG